MAEDRAVAWFEEWSWLRLLETFSLETFIPVTSFPEYLRTGQSTASPRMSVISGVGPPY